MAETLRSGLHGLRLNSVECFEPMMRETEKRVLHLLWRRCVQRGHQGQLQHRRRRGDLLLYATRAALYAQQSAAKQLGNSFEQ